MQRSAACLLVACMVLLASACADDFEGETAGGSAVGSNGDVVGGACRDGECASGSYCEQSGSFPGGVCTVECSGDDDCPADTHCVSTQGGICLLSCDRAADCREGYSCDTESNKAGGGESRVCTD